MAWPMFLHNYRILLNVNTESWPQEADGEGLGTFQETCSFRDHFMGVLHTKSRMRMLMHALKEAPFLEPQWWSLIIWESATCLFQVWWQWRLLWQCPAAVYIAAPGHSSLSVCEGQGTPARAVQIPRAVHRYSNYLGHYSDSSRWAHFHSLILYTN